MRILAIYPIFPHPLNNGGKIRAHQVIETLVQRHEVDFLGLYGKEDNPAEWPLAKRFGNPPQVFRAGEGAPSGAGKELWRLRPKPWEGPPRWVAMRDTGALWNALASLPLQDYDAILTRTLAMAPYALAARRQAARPRLVMDLDDILSIVRRRQIVSEKLSWFSRHGASLRIDAWRLRRYEDACLREFDSVWICSETDRRTLASRIGSSRVRIVPNSIDLGAFQPQPETPEPALLYVGDFRIPFNVQAASWFLAEAWPKIRKTAPQAQLWLVGRQPPPGLLSRHAPESGVIVTGTVPDVRPYLARAAVSIAPLRVGGGTRIKILEAMAAGLPVVATPVGAEGIDARPGEEILLDDSAEGLARHCITLLGDEPRRRALAAAGRRCVELRYGLAAMRDSIVSCFDSLEARLPPMT